MKFLIWFLCILANAIITVLINNAGIILGGIPSALMFAATFGLARTLCKKWDAHKEYGGMEKDILRADNQIRFCKKCGERLLENSKFCRKCGAEVHQE